MVKATSVAAEQPFSTLSRVKLCDVLCVLEVHSIMEQDTTENKINAVKTLLSGYSRGRDNWPLNR